MNQEEKRDWGWRKGSISHEAKCRWDRKGISHVVSRLPFTLIISYDRCRLIKIGRKWKVERTNEGTLFFPYMRTENRKSLEKWYENMSRSKWEMTGNEIEGHITVVRIWKCSCISWTTLGAHLRNLRQV